MALKFARQSHIITTGIPFLVGDACWFWVVNSFSLGFAGQIPNVHQRNAVAMERWSDCAEAYEEVVQAVEVPKSQTCTLLHASRILSGLDYISIATRICFGSSLATVTTATPNPNRQYH
eukprot:1899816-Amphidinium_carterae.1